MFGHASLSRHIRPIKIKSCTKVHNTDKMAVFALISYFVLLFKKYQKVSFVKIVSVISLLYPYYKIRYHLVRNALSSRYRKKVSNFKILTHCHTCQTNLVTPAFMPHIARRGNKRLHSCEKSSNFAPVLIYRFYNVQTAR